MEMESDELKAKLSVLHGPIGGMFAEVETRLEKLPTTEKRVSVVPAEEKSTGAKSE